MTESPYGTLSKILRTDEAVLDTALTAHAARHGCTDGSCDGRRVLGDALADIRELHDALDG